MPWQKVYKRKLTPEQIKEIAAMYVDPTLRRSDIEAAYNLTQGEMQGLVDDLGLKSTRLKPAEHTSKSATLETVTVQLNELQQQRDALDKQLAELRSMRESLLIRFEWEGDDVHVYGITAVPMIASKQAWLSFLTHEGPRKLREFINAKNVH